MIRLEPYDIYLGIYKSCVKTPHDLKSSYPDIIIAASSPTNYIFSIRQLKVMALNFLETLYIEKWIHNLDLRFLAFILLENQITRIIDILKGSNEKVMIVLAEKDIDLTSICKYHDIPDESPRDMKFMMDLAMFRGKLEKER